MVYLPFLFIIVVAFIFYMYKSDQIAAIKRDGVRVAGTIIHNSDGAPNSQFRLGGNINNATITFFTKEGKEITGSPVNAFITQYEVIVPSEVYIIYDTKNPERFFVESG